MPQRISYSVLDPWFLPGIRTLYDRLGLPSWFPPEGLVAIGHLLAILAAVGFAFAATHWWGGILVMVGVIGNHLVDCWDGMHARRTNQCRNGGELLDHFVDPLSFSYYLCGLAVAINRLDWGLVAVICLYATAVLTNIKAKMLDRFTLARFGPTEFKSLLVLYGMMMSLHSWFTAGNVVAITGVILTRWFLGALIVVGLVQLVANLVWAVREVNAAGLPPDSSELKMK